MNLQNPVGDPVDKANNPNVPITFSDIQEEVINFGRCIECHSDANPEGGVSLSSYNVILAQSGLVENGNANASRFYLEVAAGRMPPAEPLTSARVKLLQRWIDEGLKQ